MLREFNFLFNKLPHHMIFYPTSRCNLFCEHCFNWKRQDNLNGETGINNELSLDEIDKFSKNLGHLKSLTITGGEPFLRNDIKEIVEIFYKNNGLQYVSIHSHGLMNKRVVDTLQNILHNLKDIYVIYCTSIDGLEKKHNEIRGAKDGFNKTVNTIKSVQDVKEKYFNRLFILTSTIFSLSSQEEYIETIKYIKSNLKYVSPRACFIRGDVRNNEEKKINQNLYDDYIRLTSENIDNTVNPFSGMAVKETIESLTSKVVIDNFKQNKQTVPCQAGNKMIVLYENGDVYPCEQLSENGKLGNLRNFNFNLKNMLNTKKSKCIIKDINPGKKCNCTWENAIGVSMLYDKKSWLKIFFHWIKIFLFKKKNLAK